MRTLTYYAHEIADGTSIVLGDKPHHVVKATRMDLCAGVEIALKLDPCDCHTGPSNTLFVSPVDLIVVPTETG